MSARGSIGTFRRLRAACDVAEYIYIYIYLSLSFGKMSAFAVTVKVKFFNKIHFRPLTK